MQNLDCRVCDAYIQPKKLHMRKICDYFCSIFSLLSAAVAKTPCIRKKYTYAKKMNKVIIIFHVGNLNNLQKDEEKNTENFSG